MKSFEAQSPELARRFGFLLDNILRAAPHTLGAEAEGVMAAAGNVLAQPDNIYSQLSNGEAAVPVADALRRHQDRPARSGGLYQIPPGREPRRPQEGVRRVLGHLAEI